MIEHEDFRAAVFRQSHLKMTGKSNVNDVEQVWQYGDFQHVPVLASSCRTYFLGEIYSLQKPGVFDSKQMWKTSFPWDVYLPIQWLSANPTNWVIIQKRIPALQTNMTQTTRECSGSEFSTTKLSKWPFNGRLSCYGNCHSDYRL